LLAGSQDTAAALADCGGKPVWTISARVQIAEDSFTCDFLNQPNRDDDSAKDNAKIAKMPNAQLDWKIMPEFDQTSKWQRFANVYFYYFPVAFPRYKIDMR
jgi:hypothetical protein